MIYIFRGTARSPPAMWNKKPFTKLLGVTILAIGLRSVINDLKYAAGSHSVSNDKYKDVYAPTTKYQYKVLKQLESVDFINDIRRERAKANMPYIHYQ